MIISGEDALGLFDDLPAPSRDGRHADDHQQFVHRAAGGCRRLLLPGYSRLSFLVGEIAPLPARVEHVGTHKASSAG
jgi:hypothetical protein